MRQGGRYRSIFVGHITADYAWYALVSLGVSGGVPEEAVTKRFLELVPAGHGPMLSIKGRGCQVGYTYFDNAFDNDIN